MTDPMIENSDCPKGLFIVLEGADGAGKSTQIDKLMHWCMSLKREVVVTREPGGTPVAEQLREIIKHTEEPVCVDTELLLLMAARRQHLDQVVCPALSQGKIVLCDRYLLSTLVYQGLAKGYPLHEILNMHHRFCHGILPDLTILLDISVEESMRRLSNRCQDSAPPDRFDSDLSILPKLAGYYRQAAKMSTTLGVGGKVATLYAEAGEDPVYRGLNQLLRDNFEELQ